MVFVLTKNGGLTRREYVLSGESSKEEENMALQASTTHGDVVSEAKSANRPEFEAVLPLILSVMASREDANGLVKNGGIGAEIATKTGVDPRASGSWFMALVKRGYVKRVRARYANKGKVCDCLQILSKGRRLLAKTRMGNDSGDLPLEVPARPIRKSRVQRNSAKVQPTEISADNPAAMMAKVIRMAEVYADALKVVDDPVYKQAHDLLKGMQEFTKKIGK